jgi:hypothetical protein
MAWQPGFPARAGKEQDLFWRQLLGELLREAVREPGVSGLRLSGEARSVDRPSSSRRARLRPFRPRRESSRRTGAAAQAFAASRRRRALRLRTAANGADRQTCRPEVVERGLGQRFRLRLGCAPELSREMLPPASHWLTAPSVTPTAAANAFWVRCLSRRYAMSFSITARV